MTNFSLLPLGVKPRFPLGHIAMTTRALRTLHLGDMSDALARHAQCDWGEISSEDRDRNESALWEMGRLHSVYHDRNGVKFWIMSEANRRATTVLLPDEY